MRNKERDRLKTQKLKKMGWTVITVWECQINKRLDATVQRILKSLER
jgi:DNA mismatch endonuclease (patch repair protein)